MRTPGDDGELAAGFLFTEGIIKIAGSDQTDPSLRPEDRQSRQARSIVPAALNSNTIRVDLNDGVDIDLKRLERHFYTTSSCGVCGKSSIEALQTGRAKPLTDSRHDRSIAN